MVDIALEEFIINDIKLIVNPADIQMMDDDYVEEDSFLRSKSVFSFRSRYSNNKVIMTIPFQITDFSTMLEEEQLNTTNCVKLIAELNAFPYCFIKSNRLNSYIAPLTTDSRNSGYSLFGVDEISITTNVQATDIVFLELVLQVFNHFPLTKDFAFIDSLEKRTIVPSLDKSAVWKKYIYPKIYKAVQRLSDSGILASLSDKSRDSYPLSNVRILTPLVSEINDTSINAEDGVYISDKAKVITVTNLNKSGDEDFLAQLAKQDFNNNPYDKTATAIKQLFIQWSGRTLDSLGVQVQNITVKKKNKLVTHTIGTFRHPVIQHFGSYPIQCSISMISSNHKVYEYESGSNVNTLIKEMFNVLDHNRTIFPEAEAYNYLQVHSLGTVLLDAVGFIPNQSQIVASSSSEGIESLTYSFTQSDMSSFIEMGLVESSGKNSVSKIDKEGYKIVKQWLQVFLSTIDRGLLDSGYVGNIPEEGLLNIYDIYRLSTNLADALAREFNLENTDRFKAVELFRDSSKELVIGDKGSRTMHALVFDVPADDTFNLLLWKSDLDFNAAKNSKTYRVDKKLFFTNNIKYLIHLIDLKLQMINRETPPDVVYYPSGASQNILRGILNNIDLGARGDEIISKSVSNAAPQGSTVTNSEFISQAVKENSFRFYGQALEDLELEDVLDTEYDRETDTVMDNIDPFFFVAEENNLQVEDMLDYYTQSKSVAIDEEIKDASEESFKTQQGVENIQYIGIDYREIKEVKNRVNNAIVTNINDTSEFVVNSWIAAIAVFSAPLANSLRNLRQSDASGVKAEYEKQLENKKAVIEQKPVQPNVVNAINSKLKAAGYDTPILKDFVYNSLNKESANGHSIGNNPSTQGLFQIQKDALIDTLMKGNNPSRGFGGYKSESAARQKAESIMNSGALKDPAYNTEVFLQYNDLLVKDMKSQGIPESLADSPFYRFAGHNLGAGGAKAVYLYRTTGQMPSDKTLSNITNQLSTPARNLDSQAKVEAYIWKYTAHFGTPSGQVTKPAENSSKAPATLNVGGSLAGSVVSVDKSNVQVQTSTGLLSLNYVGEDKKIDLEKELKGKAVIASSTVQNGTKYVTITLPSGKQIITSQDEKVVAASIAANPTKITIKSEDQVVGKGAEQPFKKGVTFAITSPFGMRGRAMHKGVDFGCPVNTEVTAAADGIVSLVKVDSKGLNSGYGRYIKIDHGNGLETKYAHLNKWLVKQGQKVRYQEVIGLSGNTGKSTGPHLHYEVIFRGVAYDPLKTSALQTFDSNGVLSLPDGNTSSPYTYTPGEDRSEHITDFNKVFNEDKLTEEIFHNLGKYVNIGLKAGFPTIRAYITVGNETDDLFLASFKSDVQYYELKGLKSVHINTNNDTNPVDVLVMSVADPSFMNSDSYAAYSRMAHTDITNIGTDYETQFVSNRIKILPGMKLHVLMGYGNNINDLEPVFNGSISEVDNGNSQVLQIVAEGFGKELLGEIINPDIPKKANNAGSATTADVIGFTLRSAAINHFGMRPSYKGTVLTDAYDPENRPLGVGVLSVKYSAFFDLDQSNLSSRLYINIFAPEIEDVDDMFKSAYLGYFLSGNLKDKAFGYPFYIWKMTPWDCIKQMEYRHPGAIAKPMLYQNRMTMFFGIKEQMYFYKDYDRLVMDSAARTGNSQAIKQYYDNRRERMKPVCNIHMVTSNTNLISNNLKINSNYSTTTNVSYFNDNNDINEPYTWPSHKMSIDDNLFPWDIREKELTLTGCHSKYTSFLYGTTDLKKECEKMYGGKIFIIGNPTIKSGDYIYLDDDSRKLKGFILVRECIHHFDDNSGFVTEITPGQYVEPANFMYTSLWVRLLACCQVGSSLLRFNYSEDSMSEQFQLAYSFLNLVQQMNSTTHRNAWDDNTSILVESALGVSFVYFLAAKTYKFFGLKGLPLRNISAFTSTSIKSALKFQFGGNPVMFSQFIKAGEMRLGSTVSSWIRKGYGLAKGATSWTRSTKAYSTSGKFFAENIDKFKNLKWVETLRASRLYGGGKFLFGVGKTVGMFATRAALSAAAGILVGLLTTNPVGILIDLVVLFAVSWAVAKIEESTLTRQPLLFFPLTKHGKPYTGGMNGVIRNGAWDAFTTEFEKSYKQVIKAVDILSINARNNDKNPWYLPNADLVGKNSVPLYKDGEYKSSEIKAYGKPAETSRADITDAKITKTLAESISKNKE